MRWAILCTSLLGMSIAMAPSTTERVRVLEDRVYALEEQLDALYTPTEPWHIEIRYINNHVSAIGSRCAATDAFLMQHMRNHNTTSIFGRQQ